MKKWIVWMIALAALPASTFWAQNVQNLTGTWQGALKTPNGQQLRIVIKISVADDKLRAVLYSISVIRSGHDQAEHPEQTGQVIYREGR
jgi:hypothetical protein